MSVEELLDRSEVVLRDGEVVVEEDDNLAQRRFESAMLRTLGASGRTVLEGILAEFTALGVLAGLLAALGASYAGRFVATRVLQVPYAFDPLVLLLGVGGGALIVAASGWLATRTVAAQPPVNTLRLG